MRRLAALAAAAAVALAACGGGPTLDVTPPSVPDNLVPASVQGGDLSFYRSTLPKVKASFTEAGSDALTADGELWELRRNERLLGVLQLTTLLSDVDLEREEHREAILRQVMPATVDQLTVGDVRVWATSSNDKIVFLWFGQRLFAVLSLKGTEQDLDHEGVLDEVVTFTTTSDEWEPLYIDDEAEDA